MTPPEALPADLISHGDQPPAVSRFCPMITVIKNRSDFLLAARARKKGVGSMMVQARRRAPDEASGIRVGYTCSKKVGNAVARNRAKRRMREVARAILPEMGRDGWDYVLIGRAEQTDQRPFELLKDDLRHALDHLHSNSKSKRHKK